MEEEKKTPSNTGHLAARDLGPKSPFFITQHSRKCCLRLSIRQKYYFGQEVGSTEGWTERLNLGLQ